MLTLTKLSTVTVAETTSVSSAKLPTMTDVKLGQPTKECPSAVCKLARPGTLAYWMCRTVEVVGYADLDL
jgi:hypothetical protein